MRTVLKPTRDTLSELLFSISEWENVITMGEFSARTQLQVWRKKIEYRLACKTSYELYTLFQFPRWAATFWRHALKDSWCIIFVGNILSPDKIDGVRELSFGTIYFHAVYNKFGCEDSCYKNPLYVFNPCKLATEYIINRANQQLGWALSF